ncbi:MAG: exopolysaccharide biosynthesis protein [Cyanobacteria bacterium J06642_2]
MAKLSEDLTAFLRAPERGDKISMSEIQTLAGERGFGFLFIILALPSALPVPAPGYSIPFGLVLGFLALQMVAGRQTPWLPQRARRASVPLDLGRALLEKGTWLLQRAEFFTRPRLPWLCQSFVGRRALGVAIALMATSMLIPVPGTNTLPAFSIFVMGFGLLDDDGIVSLLGLLVSAIAGAVSISILFFGFNILKLFIQQLKAAF